MWAVLSGQSYILPRCSFSKALPELAQSSAHARLAGDGAEGLAEVGERESAVVLVRRPVAAARSQSLNNA
jgi:hypothetical protein